MEDEILGLAYSIVQSDLNRLKNSKEPIGGIN